MFSSAHASFWCCWMCSLQIILTFASQLQHAALAASLKPHGLTEILSSLPVSGDVDDSLLEKLDGAIREACRALSTSS
jgi:hypothetical protein